MQLIDFMQNDDWVYYKNVASFLENDFDLASLTAPTFYTQGILGYLFSKLFNITNLPYLTIIISLLSCFLLYVILKKYLNISTGKSLLLTLFLALNPIFVYSMWGFMTENYFVFTLLLCIYFFYKYEKTNKKIDFLLLAIAIGISFMQRQVALVFPIAMFFYYMSQKKYNHGIGALSILVILIGSYETWFPKTSEMREKSLQYKHLFDLEYTFAVVYGSLIQLAALLLPIFAIFLNFKRIDKKIFVFLISTALFYLALNSYFDPHSISWGEFPYFENIWERTGFYPRGILGTKYQFIGNYDLYLYWDIIAKIAVASFLSYILIYFEKKKLMDINVYFIIVYLGLMIFTETFYDRYLLMIIPSSLLFFAKNINLDRTKQIGIAIFLCFMFIYNYQFSMDFILSNKYVWNTSEKIANDEKISPKLIQGTNAWKLVNKNIERDYLYDFSYDSQEVNETYKDLYTLVEAHKVNYPLNFYINPTIYLYRKN